MIRQGFPQQASAETSMRRVQIRIDEEMYRGLRRLAIQRQQSLSATIRDLLSRGLRRPRRRLTLKDFPWVGSFRSEDPGRVSEEHDDVLGQEPW